MRVCVSIGKKRLEDGLEQALSVQQLADVIEIRLDCMENPVVMPFCTSLKKPLLFTNRASWEGGQFNGEENDRVALLLEAAKAGVEYIDLEINAPQESQEKLICGMEASKSKLILSWHNFEETPPKEELLARMIIMQEKGAHIGKIVTMASDHRDVLRVLQLQEEARKRDFPLIAFCMGSAGVISRLATSQLGGYMTYCAVDKSEATAPGQLAVADLREIYRLMAGNDDN